MVWSVDSSKDILKVKEFMEDEFTIVGTQVGHMTVIENNQSVLVPNLLRSIDIDYKGKVAFVRVRSRHHLTSPARACRLGR